MLNIDQMGFAVVVHCAFEDPRVVALVEVDCVFSTNKNTCQQWRLAPQEDEEHTLDVVYEKTNTLYQEWWKNEGVLPVFTEQGCRSTSVRDIIKIGDDFWRVASFGFNKLEGVPDQWHQARAKINVKD